MSGPLTNAVTMLDCGVRIEPPTSMAHVYSSCAVLVTTLAAALGAEGTVEGVVGPVAGVVEVVVGAADVVVVDPWTTEPATTTVELNDDRVEVRVQFDTPLRPGMSITNWFGVVVISAPTVVGAVIVSGSTGTG